MLYRTPGRSALQGDGTVNFYYQMISKLKICCYRSVLSRDHILELLFISIPCLKLGRFCDYVLRLGPDPISENSTSTLALITVNLQFISRF